MIERPNCQRAKGRLWQRCMAQRDSSICETCGGWLGRKQGALPHCTAWNCPGRTAVRPQSPERPSIYFKDADLDRGEEHRIRSRAKVQYERPRPAVSIDVSKSPSVGLQCRPVTRAIKQLVGAVLGTASFVAILMLLVYPSIPRPGDVRRYELCADLARWPPIRFDHRLVAAGPCFGVDVTFQLHAPGGVPTPQPAAYAASHARRVEADVSGTHDITHD